MDDELKEINDSVVKPKVIVGDAENSPFTYERVVELLEFFESLYNRHPWRLKQPHYVLPITEDYKPVHTPPYSVPRSQEEAARKAIPRLTEFDVFEQIYDSEMASPAFFLAKADERLRILTDFRALNKFLKCNPKYVPLIREVLKRLGRRGGANSFRHWMQTWVSIRSSSHRPVDVLLHSVPPLASSSTKDCI